MNMEMTKEWIRNYNKKCAEFLGWKYDSKTSIHFTKGTWIDNKNIGHCAERGLSFHSDWNWIMEVVEAIERLSKVGETYMFSITKFSVRVSHKGNRIVDLPIDDTKKEAVIQAIDQFIDWYNKQKES